MGDGSLSFARKFTELREHVEGVTGGRITMTSQQWRAKRGGQPLATVTFKLTAGSDFIETETGGIDHVYSWARGFYRALRALNVAAARRE